MRLVVLHMPANVHPEYAVRIARDTIAQVEEINRKIERGEVVNDQLVTLAMPFGWTYEVVDDVDRVAPGSEALSVAADAEVFGGEH